MPIGIWKLISIFFALPRKTLENRVKFLATGKKSGAEAYIASVGDKKVRHCSFISKW